MVREIGNLSLLGFVDGITATGIVLSSMIFGIISIYHAKKLEANLLTAAGITMISIGSFWLGPTTDFFMVLLTGNNLNPVYIYGWLSYMGIAPGTIAAFYLGAELLAPEKKKIIVGVYTVIGVIFEILLWVFPLQVFEFGEHGEGDLIDSGLNRSFPGFWIIAFLLISILIFLVIGFAIKAKQVSGELRKKFTFLSLGFAIFFFCGLADSLFLLGIYLFIWRTFMMTFALWMYLGLKI